MAPDRGRACPPDAGPTTTRATESSALNMQRTKLHLTSASCLDCTWKIEYPWLMRMLASRSTAVDCASAYA